MPPIPPDQLSPHDKRKKGCRTDRTAMTPIGAANPARRAAAPPRLPHKPLVASTDLDALMSVRQVCQFFGGVSKMSLWRWAQNPTSGFPPPFKVGQKNYWVRRDILAFRDSQKAQALVAATYSQPPKIADIRGVSCRGRTARSRGETRG
jgi:predicted DNA-binding transcriptional regulator AlpA